MSVRPSACFNPLDSEGGLAVGVYAKRFGESLILVLHRLDMIPFYRNLKLNLFHPLNLLKGNGYCIYCE